jgi:phospholipase/lecithinase/hemolysin
MAMTSFVTDESDVATIRRYDLDRLYFPLHEHLTFQDNDPNFVSDLSISVLAQEKATLVTPTIGDQMNQFDTATIEIPTIDYNSDFIFTLPSDTVSDVDTINPLRNLVIFGDSLSDTGNLYSATGNTFPPPPNAPGRFSNGLIWVDYFASELGLTGENIKNFAFGGATTGKISSDVSLPIPIPGLLTQVEQFKALNAVAPIGGDALYVIWVGVNDFLSIPADPQQAVSDAINNISSAITTLAQLGAQEILVANLPDLGSTPLLSNTPNAIGATAITQSFNATLSQTLDNLAPYFNVNLFLLDKFEALQELSNGQNDYGLTDFTTPLSDVINPVFPDEYFFWDNIHPTTKGHQVIAENFINQVNERIFPDLFGYGATLENAHPSWCGV